eukprot:scaffold228171_cov28-Tisochrysis_lutea.AAC.2
MSEPHKRRVCGGLPCHKEPSQQRAEPTSVRLALKRAVRERETTSPATCSRRMDVVGKRFPSVHLRRGGQQPRGLRRPAFGGASSCQGRGGRPSFTWKSDQQFC